MVLRDAAGNEFRPGDDIKASRQKRNRVASSSGDELRRVSSSVAAGVRSRAGRARDRPQSVQKRLSHAATGKARGRVAKGSFSLPDAVPGSVPAGDAVPGAAAPETPDPRYARDVFFVGRRRTRRKRKRKRDEAETATRRRDKNVRALASRVDGVRIRVRVRVRVGLGARRRRRRGKTGERASRDARRRRRRRRRRWRVRSEPEPPEPVRGRPAGCRRRRLGVVF